MCYTLCLSLYDEFHFETNRKIKMTACGSFFHSTGCMCTFQTIYYIISEHNINWPSPRIQAVYGRWYSGRQCVHVCIHTVLLNLSTLPSYDGLKVDIFQCKKQFWIYWRCCFPGYMHPSPFKQTVDNINLQRCISMNIHFNSKSRSETTCLRRDGWI